MANSADPDQTLHIAASDQCLHCLLRPAFPNTKSKRRLPFFFFAFQEIEPIKLVWTENSKCFYSEEFKIPTGKYVGNLVIDGVFYPVEDITVKHYTFEVDLYLKDGR